MFFYITGGISMFFKNSIYLWVFLTIFLSAKEINLTMNDKNSTSRKDDVVKFAVEVGAKTNFWTPGISGNVIDYNTEGLQLGFGKLKLKLYDSDVFTLEKYATFQQSENQTELLVSYKDDKKHESSIDGFRVTLQVMKIVNYLFDKEWFNGVNYEFNQRNFLGDATLLQNSKYWFGKLNGAVAGEDFVRLERGTNLAFKTKFTSHKLSYRFDDVLHLTKGDFFSVGVFDEEWSKPTLIGDSLNGEEPLIFDANYYVRGISTTLGIKHEKYQVEGYLDYGFDNEMDIIQKGDNYSSLNRDVDMYRVGARASYRFADVYKTKFFNMDFLLGAEMQYNQLTEGSELALDAETLYGVNAGIEVVF